MRTTLTLRSRNHLDKISCINLLKIKTEVVKKWSVLFHLSLHIDIQMNVCYDLGHVILNLCHRYFKRIELTFIISSRKFMSIFFAYIKCEEMKRIQCAQASHARVNQTRLYGVIGEEEEKKEKKVVNLEI